MKKRWQLWVGFAVSGVALVLALRGINLHQVAEALAQADYVYLIPAVASQLAYLVARSVRWRILLNSEVSLLDAFAVNNIGYLVSNVLPFRLGDPARAVALGVRGKAKVSTALSTVVVDRVLDMLMVVILLAITLPFVQQAGWLREAGVVAAAAALVALAVLIALALRSEWARRVAVWLLDRAPRLNRRRWLGMVDGLLEGLSALRSIRQGLALFFWSVVTWAFVVAYYYIMLWAFLERPSLAAGSFLTCAVGLGMAVPSAPGAMGVFHTFARYALELPFGVPMDTAITVAFASHALQYIVIFVLGFISLAQQNLSLGRLRADIATTMTQEEHLG